MNKKRRIALDLDGVCADFVGSFLEQYNNKYETNFRREEITQFNIAKALRETPGRVIGLIHQMQMDERSYKEMSMIENANYYTNKLIKEGNKIYIVSDRPNASDTINWLVRTGIAYNGIYLTDKKLSVMWRKGLDTIIEDKSSIAKEVSETGRKVILLDQPWNQYAEGENIIRCHDWKEIYEVLK